MIVEEGLELVEQILVPGQLNKVQKIVFQQAWAGRSYKEIAEQFGYTLGYIKDTGSVLWQLLSEALGEKVTRQNFQAVLRRTRQQTEPSFRDCWSKRDEVVEASKENLTQSLIEKPATILHSCAPSLHHCDWGEAIDVSVFYNRTDELAMLAHLEQQVMYWLAIARESMTLEELQEDIVPQVSQRELLEALAFLQRRSLIEKAAPTLSDTSTVGFSQQPVVMEYMTERLVKQFYYDAASYELDFFNHYPLLKAQSKDYIRDTQIHLILQPVKHKLLAAFETKQNLEAHLNRLLATLRNQPSRRGYAAGNLLNLLCSPHRDMCDRN